jgi:hypothetical protein
MKARIQDKQKAIELRLKERSYSQIKKELNVSKSTLSGWLKNYPLSKEAVRKLRDLNAQRIEKYRETRRQQKEKILKEIYIKEKTNIFPLSKRDLFIAGLFLYLGEGGKTKENELILSSTNPAIVKFYIYWLINYFKIDRNKIKIKLHLYKDMDIKKEIIFWTKELKIKKSQFAKPYIKNSNKSGLTYKNGFGHGTCNAAVCNSILAKKILMGLKVIEDYFNSRYK